METQMEPLIREARPGDAQTLIDYMTSLVEEPGIDLVSMPGEFVVALEEEQEWIRQHVLNENSLLIVAEAGNEIVGLLNCTGGRRRASRHTATLGISIRKDWRGRGLGRRMMEYAVEWARGSGVIKRLQLEVFSRNARAIHLYESVGFEHEGRLRRAFYRDGEWIDSLVMAILFDGSVG